MHSNSRVQQIIPLGIGNSRGHIPLKSMKQILLAIVSFNFAPTGIATYNTESGNL